MMTLATSRDDALAGVLEVGRQLDREQQDADREDDGDDAGLVDAQRQERGATLVHAPAADAAGVLDGDAPLAFLDVHDGRHGADAQEPEGDARGQVRRAQERAPGRAGSLATMPAKMMKLMPLPMPRSVMSSPIHISRMVPATREAIMVSVSRLVRSKFGMTGTPLGLWLDSRMQVAVAPAAGPCGTVR